MNDPSPPAVAKSDAVVPISRFALIVYGICRFISVGVSRIYYPGRVIGKNQLPTTGAYILAPVHRSYIDWLLAARVTKRRMRYIAKDELWKIRALGRFFELLGAIPVQRGTPDRIAMHRALEVLRAGEPLVIFPEGTRKVGPAVEDILEGAAYLALRARVPIVPLGISGAEDAMPRGAYFPRPARVAIVVGTPLGGTDLAPAQGEAEHRMTRSQTKVLANELRETMQEVFSTAQATKLSSRLGSRGAAKRRGRKADVSISD